MNDDIHEYQAALAVPHAFPAGYVATPNQQCLIGSRLLPVRPPLTDDEVRLRHLDLKRSVARFAYSKEKLEFALDQRATLPPIGRPVLQKAAEKRVATVVAYIAEYVRQAVAKDVVGLKNTSSTQAIAALAARRALDDLSDAHSDPAVSLIAGWGEWRLHFAGHEGFVSYQGLDDSAPDLEM